MKLFGLQKLSLVDYPGKLACTIFTGGCNFRCPFCHNSGLVINIKEEEALSEEYILRFLEKRSVTLEGVCISGGEPLLNADIADFIKKIKNMGFSVKLDTNGTYPDRRKELAAAGLIDYVAMDIKNSPEKYAETIGLDSYDISKVKESVSFLLSGSVPYEFRTTLVREFHTPQDIVDIGKWISGAKNYFLQNFVDSGHIIGEGLSGFSREELGTIKEIAKDFAENVELRGI